MMHSTSCFKYICAFNRIFVKVSVCTNSSVVNHFLNNGKKRKEFLIAFPTDHFSVVLTNSLQHEVQARYLPGHFRRGTNWVHRIPCDKIRPRRFLIPVPEGGSQIKIEVIAAYIYVNYLQAAWIRSGVETEWMSIFPVSNQEFGIHRTLL